MSMQLLSKSPARVQTHRIVLSSACTLLSQVRQQRSLHLAPPFLLDEDYTPRYTTLSSRDAARKQAEAYSHLRECNLCPRRCGVNRLERAGACLIEGTATRVGTIAPHFGEEPCIQGHHGSGSVFFSGCNLRCVFCQNHDIAHTGGGMALEPDELAEWMLKLQDVGGVHNINFVTPEHVVPQVVLAILAARDRGLRVPIVYNTSAYDSGESIALLDGLVDVYLPDFKLWESAACQRLLKAADYADTARHSIALMHQQVGDLCFTPDGIARRGLLLRHLVMPGFEQDGAQIMRWVAEVLGKDTVVNVMEQYHPRAHVGKPAGRPRTKKSCVDSGSTSAKTATPQHKRYDEINRPIQDSEVQSVREAAQAAGLWRFIEPARHGGFNI